MGDPIEIIFVLFDGQSVQPIVCIARELFYGRAGSRRYKNTIRLMSRGTAFPTG